MFLGLTLLALAAHAQIPLAAGPGLTSFTDGSGEHVIYVGTDSGVYEQTLSPGAAYWSKAQLITLSLASTSSALTSFVDSSTDIFLAGEHVFFEGSGDRAIHHLFLSATSGSTWTDENLVFVTTTLNPIPTQSGSALAAFSDSSGIHVFYI